MAGGFFGPAFVPLDARDTMEQADHAARQALGIGDAVTGQALAQVAGFADVEDALAVSAHEINARPAGKRTKKFRAQPLDERFGRREKPELTGGHAKI